MEFVSYGHYWLTPAAKKRKILFILAICQFSNIHKIHRLNLVFSVFNVLC
jgi:hypothetical protein